MSYHRFIFPPFLIKLKWRVELEIKYSHHSSHLIVVLKLKINKLLTPILFYIPQSTFMLQCSYNYNILCYKKSFAQESSWNVICYSLIICTSICDYLLLCKKVIIKPPWRRLSLHKQSILFFEKLLFFSIQLHCKDCQEESSFWKKRFQIITDLKI